MSNFLLPIKLILLTTIFCITYPAYAEYKSCQDFDKSTVKKMLFEKVLYDLKELGVLLPTIDKLNNYKSSGKDDSIIKEKWEEFKNRSQLIFVGDVLEEQYKDPKICSFRVTLKLANSNQGFDALELYPRIIVQKNSSVLNLIGSESVKIENKWWLSANVTVMDEKNMSRLVGSFVDSFRRFLIVQGVFSDQTNPISIRKDFSKSLVTFGSEQLEFNDNYQNYFEKKYSQYMGVYEMLGSDKKKNSFEVISKTGDDLKIIISGCNNPKTEKAKKLAPFEFSLYGSKGTNLYFDPQFAYVSKSDSPCLMNGRYYFFGKNY
jgi:hypothetical protein